MFIKENWKNYIGIVITTALMVYMIINFNDIALFLAKTFR